MKFWENSQKTRLENFVFGLGSAGVKQAARVHTDELGLFWLANELVAGTKISPCASKHFLGGF